MNLLDYTIESGFLPHIKCDSVADAVSQLVDRLTAAGDVADGDGLIAEVLRREKDGSTAIGGGLVIPHGRYEGVAAVRVAVATLAVPLVIPAADDQPVDIVLLLVGPTGDSRQMLRVLARLARMVKEGAILDRLRAAQTPAALRAAFVDAGEIFP